MYIVERFIKNNIPEQYEYNNLKDALSKRQFLINTHEYHAMLYKDESGNYEEEADYESNRVESTIEKQQRAKIVRLMLKIDTIKELIFEMNKTSDFGSYTLAHRELIKQLKEDSDLY